MKRSILSTLFFALLWIGISNLQAQVVLNGFNYTQDFNSVTEGLPEGWSLWNGVDEVSLYSNHSNWKSTTGRFSNVASAAYGINYPDNAQKTATDRAIAVRQTQSFGNPGAAFRLAVQNTENLGNFRMSFRLQSLDYEAEKATIWSVQYSSDGNNWTTVQSSDVSGYMTTGQNVFVDRIIQVNFQNNLDNLSEPVYIQILASEAVGLGDKSAHTAIDNFNLTWTEYGQPIPLNNDATLSSLKVGGVDILKANVFDYTYKLDEGTQVMPQILPFLSDLNASFDTENIIVPTIEDVIAGVNNQAVFPIIAEDGTTRLTYTISFVFASNEPTLLANREAIDFGTIFTGETSNSKTLTISGKNLTNDIAYILKDYGSGDESNFTITNEGWNEQTGGTIYISFAPTENKAYSAYLEIISTDATTITIPITGTGYALNPTITAIPESLSFETFMGDNCEPQTVEIMAFELQSEMTVSFEDEDNAFQLTYDDNWGSMSGGILTVSFLPQTSGTYNAEILISSSDLDDNFVLNITGVATDKSDDSSLRSLKVDGLTVPGFSPEKLNYTYVFAQDYMGIPMIEAEPNETVYATVDYQQPAGIPSQVTITVTAQDGNQTVYNLYLRPYYQTPSGNYISNGDFEQWPGNIPLFWFGNKTNLAGNAVMSNDSHNGYYSILLNNPGEEHRQLTTTANYTENEYTYTISFYAKGQGFVRTGLFDEREENEGYGFNEYINVNSNDWTRYEQTIQAKNTSDNSEFIFSVHSASGLWIDDVFIEDSYILYPQIESDKDLLAFAKTYINESAEPDTITITSKDLSTPIEYNLVGEGAGSFSVTEGENWSATTGGELIVTFIPLMDVAYAVDLVIGSQEADLTVALTGTGAIRGNDASLSDILINEISLPGFNPATKNYSYMLPEKCLEPVVITPVSTDPDATIDFQSPSSLPALVTIDVTAADGITEDTYTLRIVDFYEDTNTIITNGGFETWTEGKPVAWMGDLTTPAITVAKSEDSYSGFYSTYLAWGNNNYTQFTSQNVSVKEDYRYTISFYVKGKGTIRTALFNGIQIEYKEAIEVDSDTWTQYTQEIVAPEASDIAQFMFSIRQAEGLYIDEVLITESRVLHPVLSVEETPIEFDTTFIGDKSEAYELNVVAVDLTDSISYQLTGEGTDGFVITPAEEWSNTGGGILKIEFAPKAEVEYNVNLEISQSEVSETFTIALSGQGLIKSTNAKLEDLKIDGETIEGFDPEKEEYEIVVYKSYSGVPVITATAQDRYAGVSIDETEEIPGDTEITVTAQDGVSTKTYTVSFIRSNNVSLKQLLVNSISVPGFTSEKTDYDYMLPKGTVGNPIITAKATDANATVSFQQPTALPVIVPIVVTAENGSDKRTYNLRIIEHFEEPSNNLVSNGSFESWSAYTPNGWLGSQSNISGGLSKSTDSHYGYYAAKLVNASSTAKKLSTQAFAVEYEKNYAVSFWIKGSGQITTSLFDARDGGGVSALNTYISATNTWTHHVQTISAENTSALGEIIFSVKNASGLFLDDVIITSVLKNPEITLSTNSIGFGNVFNGDDSTPQSFTVSSINLTKALTYNISGADAAAFRIEQKAWNANSGGELEVVFRPTQAKNYSATLNIGSTEVGMKTISLTGTGVTKSSIASLSNISISGVSLPNFSSTKFNYNYMLPQGFVGLPEIVATPTESHAGIVVETITEIPTYVNITVTSHDASQTEVYSVRIVPYLDESGNYITNGSFETWTGNIPNNWNGSRSNINTSNIIQTNDSHGGFLACKLINTSTSNHVRFSSTAYPVRNAYSYKITFKAKGQGQIRTGIFDNRTGGGISSYNEYISVNSDNWTEYSQMVDAINTTNEGEFIFSIVNTLGLIIDDVYVTESLTLYPEIHTNPNSLDFGTLFIDEVSEAKTVNVTSVDLSENISYSIEGSDINAFRIDEANLTTEGTISVIFDPTTNKEYTANLVLRSSKIQETVALTGTAIRRNGDATLANITVDGVSLPDFNPNQLAYRYMLPENYSGLPFVLATLSDQEEASATYEQPETIPTIVHIDVVAADKETTLTYTLTLVPYSVESPNLIANGGFELWGNNKPYFWNGSKTNIESVNVVQSTDAFKEFYSVKLINAGSSEKLFSTQVYHLTRTYSYEISFRAKGNGKVATTVYDGRSDNDGFAALNTFITVSSSWAEYKQVVKAMNTTNSGEFVFAIKNANGLFIDDVIVKRVYYPEIDTNKEFVNFGNVFVQDDSEVQKVTVSSIDLQENITYKIIGSDAAAFEVDASAWNPAIGGELGITFSPTHTGSYSAVLTISNNEVSQISIPLSGVGVARHTDASLAQLLLNNVNIDGFSSSKLEYTQVVPMASAIPTVSGVLNDNLASKTEVQATLIPGTAKVEVTAHDGTTKKVYKVNFVRSSDSSLEDIKVDGVSLTDFDPAKLNYKLMLSEGYSGIPAITVEKANQDANVSISEISSIPTIVEINVTAGDGITKTKYTVRIVNYYEELDDNFIANGGFELWTNELPDSWKGSKTTIQSSDILKSEDSNEGFYSVELVNTGATAALFSTKTYSVNSYDAYHISFMVKGKGQVATGLYDGREDNEGFAPYNETISIDTDTWTEYVQVVNAFNTTEDGEFVFSVANTDGLLIDDVFVSVKHPTLTVDAEELEFETIFINEAKTGKNVTVSSEDLSKGLTYFVEGEGAIAFSVVQTSWDSNVGGTLTVNFNASQEGEYNANLIIRSPELEDRTVALSGTAIKRNNDASLSSFTVRGISVENFNPEILDYNFMLPENYATIPIVGVTTTDENASFVIDPISSIPAKVNVVVIAEDNTTTRTYSVRILKYFKDTDSYITNGSFERWTELIPDRWFGSRTNIGSVGISKSTDSKTGFYSIQLMRENDNPARFTTKEYPVKKEYRYTISFQVKGKAKIATGLYDKREDNGGYAPYNEIIDVDTDLWEVYTQEVIARNTTEAAEFILQVYNTEDFLIDDVVVTEKRPRIDIDKDNVDFKEVFIESRSEDQTVGVVLDALTEEITYELEGDDVAAFSVVKSNWTSLKGGEMKINFNPIEVREHTARLVLKSSLGDCQIINLKGLGAAKGSDATLADIKVNGKSIPNFDPNEFKYKYFLPEPNVDDPLPIVEAICTDSLAKVSFEQPEEFSTTITFIVLAHDAETTLTYTLRLAIEGEGINDIEVPEAYAYVKDGVISVRNLPLHSRVSLYDINGHILEMKDAVSDEVQFRLDTKGGLIILVNTDKGNQIIKIINQ